MGTTGKEAGNERFALGRVTVPSSFSLFSSIPTVSTASPNPPQELFDEDTASPGSSTPPTTSFGGSVAPPKETTSQILALADGKVSASATAAASTNVLWGAAAAAVIGAATTYALDEQRKRREAEAQQRAQVQAEVSAKNSALKASREAKWEARKAAQWLEGNAMLNAQIAEAKKQGATAEQIATLKQMRGEQGLGAAIGSSMALTQDLSQQNAKIQQIRNERMANKLTRYDKEEEAKEKKKAEELQAGMAVYYNTRKQEEQETSIENKSGKVPGHASMAAVKEDDEKCPWWNLACHAKKAVNNFKAWVENLFDNEKQPPVTPNMTPQSTPTIQIMPTLTPTFPFTSTAVPTYTPIPRNPVYKIDGPMTVNQIPPEFRCTLPETKIINGMELNSDYYYRCKVGEQLMEGFLTDPNGWWWKDGQTIRWDNGAITRWKGIMNNEDVWRFGLALGLDSEGTTLRRDDILYNDSNFSEFLEQAILNKFWHFDHGVYPTYNNVPDPDVINPLGTNGRLIALGSLESLQKRIDGPDGFVKDNQFIKPASQALRAPYDGDSTNAWEVAWNSFDNLFLNEPTWIEPPAGAPYEIGNIPPSHSYYSKVEEGPGLSQVLYRSPKPEPVRAIILTYEQFSKVYSQIPK